VGVGKLAQHIGKEGTLTTHEGLVIRVKILDVRQAYGRDDVLVSPVRGSGEAWVSADRLKL
jgi:hypothetical protein